MIVPGTLVEIAADLDRCIGFGIEGFKMGWPTVHPNQDATARFLEGGFSGAGGSESQQPAQTAPGESRNSQLQAMASEHDSILVRKLGGIQHRPQDILDQHPAVLIGFRELRLERF